MNHDIIHDQFLRKSFENPNVSARRAEDRLAQFQSGKGDVATAGGKDPSGLDEALQIAAAAANA